MKSQMSYIWASDYGHNTGEGILGRLFVNRLFNKNKRFKKNKIFLIRGSTNKRSFFHKYINPFKGVLFLRLHKRNNIIFLNYLPLWNFFIFLLLTKKTILGAITGGIYKGKIKNLSGIIRKFLFPLLYKISLFIIFRKFSNVMFSTSILKKYVSKNDKKKVSFNFIFQNFNINRNSQIKTKTIDLIIYNRNHVTKKNKNYYQLVQNLYNSNLKILVFGDRFNLSQNKKFIYKDYVNRSLLFKFLEKSKFALNNQENFYSLFAIDSYNAKCMVISDKEIYNEKSLSKNFINKEFRNINSNFFRKKKFINNDKKFLNLIKKNNEILNLKLGKI